MIDKEKIINTLKKEVLDSKCLNLDYVLHQYRINPSFYLFYPFLFRDYFEVKIDLDKLSIAGFLYYLSLIEGDFLNDNNDISDEVKFDKIITLQALTEQSIKILAEIFPSDSVFWDKWALRKKEYQNVKKLEKRLKEDEFSFANYELLSDYKSSFAKIAIDSCFLLSKNNKNEENVYNALLDSQRFFSIGFQIMDDLSDIRNDINNKQFNYAVFLGQNEGFFLNNEIEYTNQIENFYNTKLPLEIFDLALEYFAKAEYAIRDYNFNSIWRNIILGKKLEVIEKKKSITTYREVNNILSSHSQDKLFIKPFEIDFVIKDSLDCGINFVKSKFKDNHWEEYLTQGGVSNYWASSFIGCNLYELSPDYNEVNFMITKAKEYLVRKENIYSYNENWSIEDADSINFALLFINNQRHDNLMIDKILSFQNIDGGFATYNNTNALETAFNNENYPNFNGWCQSHQCVSALTFTLMYKHRNKFSVEWNKLLEYTLNNYKTSSIDSYWWTSNIYTNFYNLAVIQKLIKNNEIEFKIELEIEKVKKVQNKNGSFSDYFGENIFYSAYALKILMLNFEENINEIKKGVEYLLLNQYTDGSWDNSYGMRIPSPEVINPKNEDFKKIKTFGTNCRQLEFNRLFTTSICLNTIYNYQLKLNLLKNGNKN